MRENIQVERGHSEWKFNDAEPRVAVIITDRGGHNIQNTSFKFMLGKIVHDMSIKSLCKVL